jgi:hypothetical protein
VAANGRANASRSRSVPAALLTGSFAVKRDKTATVHLEINMAQKKYKYWVVGTSMDGAETWTVDGSLTTEFKDVFTEIMLRTLADLKGGRAKLHTLSGNIEMTGIECRGPYEITALKVERDYAEVQSDAY